MMKNRNRRLFTFLKKKLKEDIFRHQTLINLYRIRFTQVLTPDLGQNPAV